MIEYAAEIFKIILWLALVLFVAAMALLIAFLGVAAVWTALT